MSLRLPGRDNAEFVDGSGISLAKKTAAPCEGYGVSLLSILVEATGAVLHPEMSQAFALEGCTPGPNPEKLSASTGPDGSA